MGTTIIQYPLPRFQAMDRDSAFNANWTFMDIPSEQTRNFKDLQPTSAQSSTNCIRIFFL